MIGDEIEIYVSRIDSDTVKSASARRATLPIYRDEIYRQIKVTNVGAVRAPGENLPRLNFRRARS